MRVPRFSFVYLEGNGERARMETFFLDNLDLAQLLRSLFFVLGGRPFANRLFGRLNRGGACRCGRRPFEILSSRNSGLQFNGGTRDDGGIARNK